MPGSRISSALKYSFLIFLMFNAVACPRRKNTVPEDTTKTYELVLKKGETLDLVLNKHLRSTQVTRILNILASCDFPFRRCLPGDSIKITIREKEFQNLIYIQNITTQYWLTRIDSVYNLAMKLPYIDTVQCFLEGTVKSTLYESFLNKGETPGLVYDFAEIFAWEIDFVTETQNGDSFSIMVKKNFVDSTLIDYADISLVRYKGLVGDFTGIYYCDAEGYDDYYNLKGESLRKALLKAPLKFSNISSHFSKRRYHPILKIWRPHHGMDYNAPAGTPVSSIGNGTVTYSGWKGGYGNLVEIRHMNNYRSRYGHLSRFAKGIYNGKKVKMGELIGYVGSTGLSTGPHLHFELHKNGVPINPLTVKLPRAPSVKKKYMEDFEHHRDSLLAFWEQRSPGTDVQISEGH